MRGVKINGTWILCTETRVHRRCGLSYGPPAEHSSGRVPFIIDACLVGPPLVHLAAVFTMHVFLTVQIKTSQSSSTQRDHIMKNVICIHLLLKKKVNKIYFQGKVQSSPLS